MANILYYKNDTLLKITGLKNPINNEFINDATVTAVVKDKFGAEVGGQSWPMTLSYVTSSNGDYQGVIEADIAVNIGDRITIEVTATATGDLEAFFKMPTQVRQRGKVE